MTQEQPEQSTQSESRGTQSHSIPVPHIRRAHWHHFWTGPKTGERGLVLKWLPPIPVNVKDNELPSSTHKVKED